MNGNDNELVKRLVSVCSNEEFNPAIISPEVMRLFLLIGSETPDNLNCHFHIEYGELEKLDSGKQVYGLKIKGKDVGLADLMNVLEDIDIPSEVLAVFPTITKAEWDAAMRMITMVLIDLECRR